VEFGYYWLHRFSHEWNTLWSGHIVHHTSEEYNLTTALRQGILQAFFSWMFYLFAAPFFPIQLMMFHYQMNSVYQFWIHTRTIKKLPAILEYILNTPSHHRVHHGRNPQYCDKNYGGTLIIWDRIFGTFEPEEEEVAYGISYSLGSWNPIYLQTHHWFEIWNVFWKTPGILEKFRVLVDRGPEYNYCILHPELMKNPVPPADLHTRPKFDAAMPNIAMSIYGFIHSLLLVVGTFFMMQEASKFSAGKASLCAAALIYGFVTVSALFERKPWATFAETLRLLFSGTLLLQILLPLMVDHCVLDLSCYAQQVVATTNKFATGILALTVLSILYLLIFNYRVGGGGSSSVATKNVVKKEQ